MKKIFAAVISFSIMLSLCSCTDPAKQEVASTTSTVSESSDTTSPKSEQRLPSEKETIFSRSKINKTLSSGVIINADVTQINNKQLSTYTGSLRIFSTKSVDKVTAAFGLSPKDAITSETTYSRDGVIPGDRVYMQFKDNKELICAANQLWYSTDTFLTMKDLLITDGSKTNLNLFSTGKNLDFATIEQAKSEIEKVFKELDISVVDEPLCYTLDYETISAENERQYAIALEESKDFDQQIFSPEKLFVTEEDACYMFYYPVAVDGLPLSRYMTGSDDGSWMPGTELVVCYSKAGIIGLSLEYQPEVIEKSEAKPIIPLEEMLDIIEAKYDSLILDGEYRIYDIRLEYIAKPIFEEENRYTLVPVWRFSIEHSFNLDKGDETGASEHFTKIIYNIFDAITGEELPIDLGGA